MGKETTAFINGARIMLQKALLDKNANEGYLRLLSEWSKGICCGKPLEIISVEKTGSGVRRILRCGHTHSAISMEEAVNLGEGFNATRLNITSSGEQQVKAQIVGGRVSKENREIEVVKLLCHYFKPHFEKFSNDIQDSPVDVITEDSSGSVEHFQVTKLYDESFWRELSKERAVDKVLPEVTSLVQAAVARKNAFDTNSKTKTILVIDAWPGVMQEFAEQVVDLPVLTSAGFKEIWIAGSIPEMTFRLYPKS